MSAFLAVGYFNYTIYLLCGIGVGIIMSIYQVAYESFYPYLISKGNFSKAYSIGSILYPICNSLMVPIAAYTQQNFGFAPLFFFNGISYWIAAVFEATIQIKEQHITQSKQKTTFTSAFLAGFHYLKRERALWYVTWYFTISTFAYGVCEALQLPFFSSHPSVGVTRYALLISMSTLGRFCGGLLQYKLQFPPRFKYHIALFVYDSVIALEILFFRLPYLWLVSLFFLYGLLGATSFNIRIGATQSYIPDHKRARFNSIFMVLTSIGLVCGQLLGGILGEVLWIPTIVLWVMLIVLAAVYVLFVRNKTSIQPFYNRKV
ncbi:MAG: MFS transporter [Erysipelotrichaceae bacterium]